MSSFLLHMQSPLQAAKFAIPPLPGSIGITHIFPLPVANAVGTIDIYNAASAIYFNTDPVTIKTIRADYFQQVSGGELSFLPLFSSTLIGYNQTRRFVLLDVKTGKVEKYSISADLETSIRGGVAVNPQKRVFAFGLEKLISLETGADHDDMLSTIITFDCSNHWHPVITSTVFSQSGMADLLWGAQAGIFFVYDRTNLLIKTLDAKGREIDHPFSRVFKDAGKRFRDLDQLYVHPSLPFALLVESDTGGKANMAVWIAAWGGSKPGMMPIITFAANERCSDFSFSNNGEFMAFRTNGYDTEKHLETFQFTWLTIDPKNPWFISSRTDLTGCQSDSGTPCSAAWTSDPASYVVNDGKNMYCWRIK